MWKERKYLDKSPPREGNHGYPTVIQSRNGRVHVTYTHSIKGSNSIKHVEFDPAWLPR
jgi:predicted neuraminidase